MRTVAGFCFLLLVAAAPVGAQSLFVLQGERAAEGSVAWSVGPFSQGGEVHGAGSLDGRWDVGFGVNRYRVELGGPDDTTLTEWTPFVRYFLYKESDDGTPVSLAARAQFFNDNYDGSDEGWYILAGAELYKRFELGTGLALFPYVGFSVAGESYSFGGAEAERAMYLTRQFGVHGLFDLNPNAWIRVTVEEHSFRRETYRAVRAAYVRRF
jgi:hypothetical protein